MGTIDNERDAVSESPQDKLDCQRYLLGDMADETERKQFEARYMDETPLYNLLLITEYDLIDAANRGQLSESDQIKYDTYYRTTAQRKERASFAADLVETARQLKETSRVETIETPELMALFRRYHLGDCSTEERETIEQTSFGNDEYFGLLVLAADTLIDEYLDGKLLEGSEDRKKFDKHFKTIPENADKIEFARMMRRVNSERRGDQNAEE